MTIFYLVRFMECELGSHEGVLGWFPNRLAAEDACTLLNTYQTEFCAWLDDYHAEPEDYDSPAWDLWFHDRRRAIEAWIVAHPGAFVHEHSKYTYYVFEVREGL